MARAELRGIPAAPGVAFGKLRRLGVRTGGARAAGDPGAEAAALDAAIADAVGDLAALAARAGGDAADMIEFQVAMLEDDALRAPAHDAIARGVPADRAWSEALAAQIADYEAADDATFRARAADLRDLAERVLRRLRGGAEETAVPLGAIVFAEDITPSRFLAIDWRGGGIALGAGSPASHVAMLARARGVPMVVGLGEGPPDGGEVALDGGAGLLLLAPDAADRCAACRARACAGRARAARPRHDGRGQAHRRAAQRRASGRAGAPRSGDVRRHRAGAHRAVLRRRPAGRGDAVRALSPHRGMGVRAAGDDPHARCRRRQARRRAHARR